MIAIVHGEVVHRQGRLVVVDTGGVGYEVQVPQRIADACPLGEHVLLHTHLDVRDDDLVLFGFLSRAERSLFLMLTSVSGIGGAIGLNALDAFDPAALRDMIARGDTTALCRIAGVGKRTAQRLALELQEKVLKLDIPGAAAAPAAAPAPAADLREDDLRSALINLEFAPPRVDATLRLMVDDLQSDASLDELLRRALSLLRSPR